MIVDIYIQDEDKVSSYPQDIIWLTQEEEVELWEMIFDLIWRYVDIANNQLQVTLSPNLKNRIIDDVVSNDTKW